MTDDEFKKMSRSVFPTDPIESTPALKNYGLNQAPKLPKTDIHLFSVEELLALRDEIDNRLPHKNLRSMNLEQEVLLQFMKAKELQSKVADDDETPTNQKAQVANTVAKLLGDLTRMRNEIYNSEQARLLEATIARALKNMPESFCLTFYDAYGKAAEEMAVA